MLYFLSSTFDLEGFSLSLRFFVSCLSAFGIMLGLGPAVIRRLARVQTQQPVREYVPQRHLTKTGTPSLGGLLIIGTIVFNTLLWAQWSNRYIWIVLSSLVGFGAIGFADDYLKLLRKNSDGLSARYKYAWQSLIGLSIALGLYLTASSAVETQLFIPFLSKITGFSLGLGFIPWIYLVIVSSSNAVNLTDGLDGLAILPVAIIAGGLAIFAVASTSDQFATPFITGGEELAVLCGAIIGTSLGFLWFNSHPARIFMGDVGALSLGATLGTLAVILRQEFSLLIMAGVFVLETVSVILQVFFFKRTGKRLFRMAPLHHHLELKGWSETTITVRFWILTFIFTFIGLTPLMV